MSGLPSTMKALVVTEPGHGAIVSDRPLPRPRPGHMIVKTHSLGLNPTDWKHMSWWSPVGSLIGCDYSGTVVSVDKAVHKNFKPGDRVCGFVHGGNEMEKEDGAFAEYISVLGDVQIKIPEGLSWEEAATLGVGITTVGQSLYRSLKLAMPNKPLEPAKSQQILIYGGSTATGTLAIQYAKLSGYEVLTTCSPKNFDLVKGRGADMVWDYKDPKSIDAIKEYTKGNLKLVLDTVSLTPSAEFCGKVITPGGVYSALLPIKTPREDVENKMTMAYDLFGVKYALGPMKFDAAPQETEFGAKFWEMSAGFLKDGKIKVHPIQVNKGGLNGILEGFELMKADKVSGQKLVYNVADTA